jgi:hypothetical protein
MPVDEYGHTIQKPKNRWLFAVAVILAGIIVSVILFKNNVFDEKLASPQSATSVTPQISSSTPQNSGTSAANAIQKQQINYDNGWYEGETKNGKPHGSGTYYWKNGDRYVGEWVNDQPGRGTYYYADETVEKGKYVNGKWVKDKTSVSATSQTSSSTIASAAQKQQLNYDNGNRYEGETKNGVRHGRGTYYWKNGDRYDGEWVNDQPGRGTYYYANKTVEKGRYVNGKWIKDETSADILASAEKEFEAGNYDRAIVQYKQAGNSGKTKGYIACRDKANELIRIIGECDATVKKLLLGAQELNNTKEIRDLISNCK